MQWVFWAIFALWGLLCGLVDAVGRLLGFVVGAVLFGVGLALSATIVGAIVGVPLVLVGGALMACALFRRRRRRPRR